MEVAIKLDFDGCDENEEINSSMVTLHSDSDHEVDIHNGNYYETSLGQSQDNDISFNNNTPSPEALFSPRKEMKVVKYPPCCHTNSDSPPYKKIRALRLFDSPATPKTLLQKCAADSTSTNRPTCGIRSKFLNGQSNSKTNKPTSVIRPNSESHISPPASKQLNGTGGKHVPGSVPVANINPFTPTGMMLSRKRTRSRRDLDKNPICSEMSSPCFSETTVIDSHHEPAAPSDDALTDDDDEDAASHPSKRLSIIDANVYRYHEEFLELSLIGRGQFGSVYKCRHRLDGCIYAIKKSLKPVAGSANERIALNEVYAHAVLGKHPHVVRYYSAWAENNHMIIQNEYCNGGSLADVLESNKKTRNTFSEAQLKQILLHVAKGLKYIHSQQLVHMDIKPGNVFISREPQMCSQGEDSADDGFEEDQESEEPEDVIYKIGDLGHVTSVLNPQVEEGDCRYLPREILQEDFSHLTKADIFALGLTIYECMTARKLPLNGAEWHALRDGVFDGLSSLSTDLQLLLRLMTHPDPRDRPTAAQLVQQLSFCHPVNKSHAQLRRELNAEKLKNEILSRQLQEAAKCLQSIGPNVTSTLTAAVVTGVLAGVGPASTHSKGALTRVHSGTRSGPTTRNANSRIIGKKVNRSVSTTY